jgi:hypothetical protein
MKIQTIIRLGAIVTMVTAIGFTFGEFIYFFGAADTVLFSWVFITVVMLEVFAIMALYAAQVKRGNVFLLIGFVLLVVNFILALMNHMGDLGVVTGLISQSQLDKAGQISIFVMLGVVRDWSWPLGFVIFGYGTYRAGVFSGWSGVLLALLGMTILFRDFWIIEYIFAALSFATWAWFGLALWKKAGDLVQDVTL